MRFSTPPVVKGLLIVNIIFFLLQTYLPGGLGDMLTERLGLHYFGSPQFEYYQIITHIFLHGNFAHLFSNMFALWMFGRVFEYELGSQRFLTYYMVCGIGAALLHSGVVAWEMESVRQNVSQFLEDPTPSMFDSLVVNQFSASIKDDFLNSWYSMPSSPEYISTAIAAAKQLLIERANVVTVGASGAIFGILLAFGLMHPNDRIMLLIPPIPMKAKYFVMGYAALELYLGLADSSSNIAHFAHLGGMLFGFILLKYWKHRGKIYY